MAIKLDTSSRAELDAKEEAKKINQIFLYIKIGFVALILIYIIVCVVQCSSTSSKLKSATTTLEHEQQVLTEVKAQAEESASENQAQEEVPADEKQVVEKDLYSSYDLGVRVAELQTKLTNIGVLSNAEQDELVKLTGGRTGWFTATNTDLLAEFGKLSWKYVTEYGSTSKSYEAIWLCYSPDGKYLLAVAKGEYHDTDASKYFSAPGSNSGTPNVFMTDFGAMFMKYGLIESNGDVTDYTVEEILDMSDAMRQQLQSDTDAEQDDIRNQEYGVVDANENGDVDGSNDPTSEDKKKHDEEIKDANKEQDIENGDVSDVTF